MILLAKLATLDHPLCSGSGREASLTPPARNCLLQQSPAPRLLERRTTKGAERGSERDAGEGGY